MNINAWKIKPVFDKYIYNFDGVSFTMEGFKTNVTLDELNEGATYDDEVLTVDPSLIPDVADVRIDGLPSGMGRVVIGTQAYSLLNCKLHLF